jgi:hypothetical protein
MISEQTARSWRAKPGHTLDINQNVYTRVAFARQLEAVNRLDSSLSVN